MNEKKERPIAIVKPMARDQKIVEMEEQVRKVARIIIQRKELQRQAGELLRRWETRSDGRTMMSDAGALNRQAKVVLNGL